MKIAGHADIGEVTYESRRTRKPGGEQHYMVEVAIERDGQVRKLSYAVPVTVASNWSVDTLVWVLAVMAGNLLASVDS